MGSDLHTNPPTEAEFMIVTGKGHTAIYSRQTDGIYGRERVDTWYRTQLFVDPDMRSADVIKTVNKNMDRVHRPDLCDTGAAVPFPDTLPRRTLEAKTALQRREDELITELEQVRARIAAGETD